MTRKEFRAQMKDRILAHLAGIAESGERCPPNKILSQALNLPDTTFRGFVKDLKDEGKIKVESSGKNGQRRVFVSHLGIWTDWSDARGKQHAKRPRRTDYLKFRPEKRISDEKKTRSCLSCGAKFTSEHWGHRLCGGCRQVAA